MSTDLQTIANIFKFNAGIFDRTLQGVPAEQWFKQPGEGSNHLMWVAGHVVVHRGVALSLLGEEWSAPWRELFVRGGKLASADQYPAATAIQQAWREISDKLPAALGNISPELMSKPVEKGRPSVDGTVGGTVAFLCLHEAYHVGQMGFLRKWLGHGQAVG